MEIMLWGTFIEKGNITILLFILLCIKEAQRLFARGKKDFCYTNSIQMHAIADHLFEHTL